jgi:hypothetical protein
VAPMAPLAPCPVAPAAADGEAGKNGGCGNPRRMIMTPVEGFGGVFIYGYSLPQRVIGVAGRHARGGGCFAELVVSIWGNVAASLGITSLNDVRSMITGGCQPR